MLERGGGKGTGGGGERERAGIGWSESVGLGREGGRGERPGRERRRLGWLGGGNGRKRVRGWGRRVEGGGV